VGLDSTCTTSLMPSAELNEFVVRVFPADFPPREDIQNVFVKFLGDWSSDAYMVYLVLNTTQKLNFAKTIPQHIPTTH